MTEQVLGIDMSCNQISNGVCAASSSFYPEAEIDELRKSDFSVKTHFTDAVAASACGLFGI